MLMALTHIYASAQSEEGDALGSTIENYLTHPVIVGLAALGIILSVIGVIVYKALKKIFPGIEQTVTSKVGDDEVVTVTTKSNNSADLLPTTSGGQLVEAGYQAVLREQSGMISNLTERMEKMEGEITHLKEALYDRDRIIESKNAELSSASDRIKEQQEILETYRVGIKTRDDKIADKRTRIDALYAENARLKDQINAHEDGVH